MSIPARQSSVSTAQRAARWLIALQQADGSLRGARSINEYYKAPFGLVVTGHNREADRMLDYVARTYLKEDGDLDGTGCSWFDEFRIYPHAWLLVAAIMRGRFELTRALLPVILDYHDETGGGFFQTARAHADRRGHQEIMTTSIAGLACLWGGRLDVAARTGRWLEKIYQAQPDLTLGLYFVWDTESGLVTDFPTELARNFMVDAGQAVQRYYQYGISAAFLASLSGATGERKWLELAQAFLRASQHCQEDVYRQPQSGKIGWGAAWTYRLSGEPQDRQPAEAVLEGLRALQSEDGWWSGLNAYQRQMSVTAEPGIDVTGEFVGLVGCMELVLL